MTCLDRLLKRDLVDPLALSHQFFLAGDQVYDDDVGSMLQVAINLGHQPIGGFEVLPLDGGKTVEGNGANLPPLLRQRLCDETAKLTDKEAQSHLITLGDYPHVRAGLQPGRLGPAARGGLSVVGRGER